MKKLTEEHFNLNEEMQNAILCYGPDWAKEDIHKFRKLEEKKKKIYDKISRKKYRRKYFRYCALQEEIKWGFDMDYTWYCSDPYFYNVDEFDFGLSHKIMFIDGWKYRESVFNPLILQIPLGDYKYNDKKKI